MTVVSMADFRKAKEALKTKSQVEDVKRAVETILNLDPIKKDPPPTAFEEFLNKLEKDHDLTQVDTKADTAKKEFEAVAAKNAANKKRVEDERIAHNERLKKEMKLKKTK